MLPSIGLGGGWLRCWNKSSHELVDELTLKSSPTNSLIDNERTDKLVVSSRHGRIPNGFFTERTALRPVSLCDARMRHSRDLPKRSRHAVFRD
jgi:hypothetical protein